MPLCLSGRQAKAGYALAMLQIIAAITAITKMLGKPVIANIPNTDNSHNISIAAATCLTGAGNNDNAQIIAKNINTLHKVMALPLIENSTQSGIVRPGSLTYPKIHKTASTANKIPIFHLFYFLSVVFW